MADLALQWWSGHLCMHRQLISQLKATAVKEVRSQEILQDSVLWNGIWNSFSFKLDVYHASTIIIMMIIVIQVS